MNLAGKSCSLSSGIRQGGWLLIVIIAAILLPRKSFSVGGCNTFNAAQSNITMDSCSGTLCFQTEMSVDGMHGTVQWHVDFGDGDFFDTTTAGTGSVMITLNLCHQYATSGYFVGTLSVTPAHTSCMTQFQVWVPPKHTTTFTYNNTCFNNPNVFIAQSNVPVSSWHWNFGDGTTSSLQNPTHIYAAPGTYTVSLVSVAMGCPDTIKHTVVVSPLPKANFSSHSACWGRPTCFTNLSTITSGSITGWNWNFGDPNSGTQNTSTLQNPCHVFTDTGRYSITLTVISDNACQEAFQAISVPVSAKPKAGFNSTPVCLGNKTYFENISNGAMSCKWDFGDPISGQLNFSVLQNPSYTYSGDGIYYVRLIVTNSVGCEDTVINPVTVYKRPVALFADSIKECTPYCGTFRDLSHPGDDVISDWKWDFAGGSPQSSSSKNPSICYDKPGTYDVSLIVTTNNGCRDTLLKKQFVSIYPLPKADFSVSRYRSDAANPAFNFFHSWSSDVVKWYWDFGDGSSLDSTRIDPSYSYKSAIAGNDFYSFTISILVQNIYGCLDTVSRRVEIDPEFFFFIPNAVTSNEDNKNEFFYGKGRGIEEYTIWIFDRWGKLIWTCHDEGSNMPWDSGMMEGMPSACKWDSKITNHTNEKKVQQEVYVWKVQLRNIFKKEFNYMGTVTVVK